MQIITYGLDLAKNAMSWHAAVLGGALGQH